MLNHIILLTFISISSLTSASPIPDEPIPITPLAITLPVLDRSTTVSPVTESSNSALSSVTSISDGSASSTELDLSKTSTDITTNTDATSTTEQSSSSSSGTTTSESNSPSTTESVSSTSAESTVLTESTTRNLETTSLASSSGSSSSTESTSTKATESGTAEKPNDQETDEWDNYLAAQMTFGDPRQIWPNSVNDLDKFCKLQKKKSLDDHIKFYDGLYPDNKLVQKVGKVFAEDGVAYVKILCDNTNNTIGVTKDGIAANVASRETKGLRDGLRDNMMIAFTSPEKTSMEYFLCLIDTWAKSTEGMYVVVQDFVKEYLTKTADRISKVLEEETKTQKINSCKEFLTTDKKVTEKPQKSLQLVILKALNSMSKHHVKT